MHAPLVRLDRAPMAEKIRFCCNLPRDHRPAVKLAQRAMRFHKFNGEFQTNRPAQQGV